MSLKINSIHFFLGLYGVYFPNNHTAFSASAMGFTLGLSLGSAISTYFCTYIKVYVYLIIVALALVCYITLIFKHNIPKVQIEQKKSETTQTEFESYEEKF